jgi:hypothetical protein
LGKIPAITGHAAADGRWEEEIIEDLRELT